MKTVKVLIADYSEDLTNFPETPADIAAYQKKTKFLEVVAESDKLFDLLAEFYNNADQYRLDQQYDLYLSTKDRELDIVRGYFKLLDLKVKAVRRYMFGDILLYIILN